MERKPEPDRVLTTGDLARAFEVDPKTIHRWCHTLGLPMERLPSGHRRFREHAVRAWYRRRTQGVDLGR